MWQMVLTQRILSHGHGRALDNLELVQWWKKRERGGREEELRQRTREKATVAKCLGAGRGACSQERECSWSLG